MFAIYSEHTRGRVQGSGGMGLGMNERWMGGWVGGRVAIFPVDEDSHPMKDGEGQNGGREGLFFVGWCIRHAGKNVWTCFCSKDTVVALL